MILLFDDSASASSSFYLSPPRDIKEVTLFLVSPICAADYIHDKVSINV